MKDVIMTTIMSNNDKYNAMGNHNKLSAMYNHIDG